MIKIIISCSILLSPFQLIAQNSGWQIQDSGTTQRLYAISFFDDTTGIIVGWQGTILRTTDGGDKWEKIPSDSLMHLRSLSIVDDNLAYAGGSGVIKTTNSGKTWEQISDHSCSAICFVDSLHGWSISSTSNDSVFKTIDGGITWTPYWASHPSWLKSVFFINENKGWAGGLYTIITGTIDGGLTWPFGASVIGPNTTIMASVYTIYFIDENEGWVGTVGVFHTEDGGHTWEHQNSLNNHYPSDIYFTDKLNGWTTSSDGKIGHTENGGKLWELQNSGTSEHLYSIHFINHRQGWIVGNNGIILKTSNGGITSLVSDNDINTIINSPHLNANYPNPFNNRTSIRFKLFQPGFVTLSIYDISGKKLMSIIDNKRLNIGVHEINWNATNAIGADVSSGIYFCDLRVDQFRDQIKILLIR